MTSVNLKELLSCCCDVADRAATIIRRVHAKRLEGGNDALQAELKDESCERSWATVADTQAQAVMEAALLKEYPGLLIVGEEDLPADFPQPSVEEISGLSKNHPACAKLTAPARHVTVPLSTVTVFIDPVDGTREFVEGRVQNVCVLVGIAVRGEAVAGVIGLPFWKHASNDGPTPTGRLTEFNGSGSSKSAILCGIVDGEGGIGGLSPEDETARQESIDGRATRALRLAASAEGKVGTPVSDAREALCTATKDWTSPFTLVPTGASGNKVVAVLLGNSDACLLNTKCSLWDTCAPEAVLRACGGICTDYFGAHFLHSKHNPLGMGNKLGGIASAKGVDHVRIWKRLSASSGVTKLLDSTGLGAFGEDSSSTEHVPIASDIARTIQGAPLTTEILTKAIEGSSPIVAFAAPDCSAVRYKMAECVRLCLRYKKEDQDECEKRPESVFVKRSVMRDLMHARAKITSAPHKLARDVRSYAVETAFLGSKACSLLAASPSSVNDITNKSEAQGQGVIRLAKALFSEGHVEPDSYIDSSFLVVLEDFTAQDGWKQQGFLETRELMSSVWALGRFHAFFWNGRVGTHSPTSEEATSKEIVSQLEAAVWDSGCYWSPKRQAADQIDKLKERFEKHGYSKNFAPHVKAKAGRDIELEGLAEKLQAHVQECARASHLYLSPMAGKDGTPFVTAPDVGENKTTGAETQSARSRLHPQRTLIHGDLKAANLFFRPKQGTTTDEVDTGFIDFQWAGWGLGAVDLAYMMCAAAGPNALDLTANAEAEVALLKHYHASLCAALVEFGVAPSVEIAARDVHPFDVLVSQYEAALLDHSVTVFSYLWDGLKASPSVLQERGVKFALTANAVNKSPECAAWLLGRCAMLVEKRECGSNKE